MPTSLFPVPHKLISPWMLKWRRKWKCKDARNKRHDGLEMKEKIRSNLPRWVKLSRWVHLGTCILELMWYEPIHTYSTYIHNIRIVIWRVNVRFSLLVYFLAYLYLYGYFGASSLSARLYFCSSLLSLPVSLNIIRYLCYNEHSTRFTILSDHAHSYVSNILHIRSHLTTPTV